jgi:hypothetical protein
MEASVVLELKLLYVGIYSHPFHLLTAICPKWSFAPLLA